MSDTDLKARRLALAQSIKPLTDAEKALLRRVIDEEISRVGDRGQRYEVTYFDPRENVRKVFGWSDDAEGARAMGDSIDAHPVWQFPQVLDRNITPELVAAAPDLLALAKQYASECGECDGSGLVTVHIPGDEGVPESDADDQPCPDCADIREIIRRAEGP